jgi:hypothetical protein
MRRSRQRNTNFIQAEDWHSGGCLQRLTSGMAKLFVVSAHRDDGKRFIVQTDKLLTAFVELERITQRGLIHSRFWKIASGLIDVSCT